MGLDAATVSLQASGSYSVPAGPTTLGASTAPVVGLSLPFVGGTGPNQATLLGSCQRTLTGAEDVDLTATLRDPAGNAFDFSAVPGVKVLVILNQATTPGQDLKVGGAAANGWAGTAAPNAGPFNGASDKVLVKAGGFVAFGDPLSGFGVASGSKLLHVDAGANTVQYELFVLG